MTVEGEDRSTNMGMCILLLNRVWTHQPDDKVWIMNIWDQQAVKTSHQDKPSRQAIVKCVHWGFQCGRFHQWGYTQIIHFHGIFPEKTIIRLLGYPHDYGNPHVTWGPFRRNQHSRPIQSKWHAQNHCEQDHCEHRKDTGNLPDSLFHDQWETSCDNPQHAQTQKMSRIAFPSEPQLKWQITETLISGYTAR